MKPMLASDADVAILKYPLIVQPKIDGVRALNLCGQLTGRSLKTHGNSYTTHKFSALQYIGFDGEMAAAKENHPDLCRLTTSAIASYDGEPNLTWHVFDYITEETLFLPYRVRYKMLCLRVLQLKHLISNVEIVRCHEVYNLKELDEFEERCLITGYEGIIIRDPEGKYKEGRSTKKEGGLLRIKRFTDAEGIVVKLIEGEHNANEAVKNPLGQTERSTHQANMIPNGMIGAMILKTTDGKEVKVAPGKMTHDERIFYWQNPNKILGNMVKYKSFMHGVKDKLRFPTYQGFRTSSDIS